MTASLTGFSYILDAVNNNMKSEKDFSIKPSPFKVALS